MLKNLTSTIVSLFIVLFSHMAMAQFVVQDSRGEQVLESVPKRVVALNWDIAEQVLELGVTPVAVTDIDGYKEWVVQPDIPSDVQDVGMRAEPNFEKITAVNPDVILVASPQADLIPQLEKIAPVLYFHTYSENHDNSLMAVNNFKAIAVVLGKEAEAQKKLVEMDVEIAQLKQQLAEAYGPKMPKVALFRFANMTSVYLYGDNSTAQYALNLLGFESAIPQKSTQWGVTQIRLPELRKVNDGIALYIEPFNEESKLDKSVIWNAMPFVKANKVSSVKPVWSYGGAMSIKYTAKALAKSLLEIAPQSKMLSNSVK
ncbi:ABC transporter substrate-binding protein [Aliivibrio fischeri]|uniref:ABC transporter substrate-binding protein n=1 Tax=Aliivibrio fischeri TaxID=668 RepID=A0A6N3YX71_ALIFS|nr:iron-siderophore ABC transporter substrate-binding protein [Aliivibrio fischeri]MUK45048.1 ABC transporter substrate-binding protein [Aliivibrio fischeri]MUK80707.1 ABC transporter substrate-binding protein [Aliivibrio fischeri]MUK84284.1 ABC transporter substrate-binding protein [Aliivibrio fischeri]